jgi:hypothetical protein
MERPRWWDRALWFRSYTPGGYDGWRTPGGRKLPCATMHQAVSDPSPDLQDLIRRIANRRRQ